MPKSDIEVRASTISLTIIRVNYVDWVKQLLDLPDEEQPIELGPLPCGVSTTAPVKKRIIGIDM